MSESASSSSPQVEQQGRATPTSGGKDSTPQRSAFLRSASVPTLDKAAPRLVPRWIFAQGKTWVPFGIGDSKKLEESYNTEQQQRVKDDKQEEKQVSSTSGQEKQGISVDPLPEPDPTQPLPNWRVPVGEDHMLEVDLRNPTRPNLHPVFWKSPPVDVRRGEWFFESSRLAPCETELSLELSQHYLNVQPWTSAYAEELKASASIGSEGEEKLKCHLKSLKGSYVIFSGSHLARIYQDGVSQRLAKTLLTAWSGEHGGGTLVVRGYDQVQKLIKARKGDSKKKKANTTAAGSSPLQSREDQQQLRTSKEAPEGTAQPKDKQTTTDDAAQRLAASSTATNAAIDSSPQKGQVEPASSSPSTPQKGQAEVGSSSSSAASVAPPTQAQAQAQNDLWTNFTNRLSSWGASAPLSEKTQRDISESFRDAQQRITDSIPEKTSELNAREARAATVIEEDEYEDDEEEELAKEKEMEEEEVELVICWHGIGQKLAEEWKALEFSLAVNSLKTLARTKSKSEPPSSIGGGGFPTLTKGKRLAFLPINWRATLNEFQPKKEFEDEDEDPEEHLDNQVGLDDIFGKSDSIPLARSITKNLLLDIPLFLSHHRAEVLRRCIKETNRAYALFCQRNPNFRSQENGGKVSMICHSLGAVLATDILSAQPTFIPDTSKLSASEILKSPHLAYNTRSLYLCGSPAALFYYLHSRQLIARSTKDEKERKDEALNRPVWGCLSVDKIWNVYNSTDPIGTCLNGCVDTRLASKREATSMDRVVSAILSTLPGAIDPSKNPSTGTAKDKKTQESSALGLFGTWSKSSVPPAALDNSASNLESASASNDNLPDLDDASGTLAGTNASTPSNRLSWASRIARSRKKLAGGGETDSRPSSSGKGKDDATNPDQSQASGLTYPPPAAAATAPPPSATETDDPKPEPSVNEHVEQSGHDPQASKDKSTKDEDGDSPADTKPEDQAKRSSLSTRYDRAYRRMMRLNPLANIDYMIPKPPQSYLPVPSSMLEYVGMLQAHATYWTNEPFVEFLLATISFDDHDDKDWKKVRDHLHGSDHVTRWKKEYFED
ncbi:unnamed protein product [Sympodiomycopsis kandeliae]